MASSAVVRYPVTLFCIATIIFIQAELNETYAEKYEMTSEVMVSSIFLRCTDDDQFRCEKGDVQCLDRSHVCDGLPDCPNGYDESVEQCGCLPAEFQCNSTVCIELNQRCDRTADCVDGLDEEDCETFICPETHFRCDNHMCIPRDKACNFIDDCGDQSDEMNCERRKCYPTEFQCNNSQCVSVVHICDGEKDCVDGSDEHPTECDKHFRCSMGFYIRKDMQCDGWADCFFSHDDETDCGACLPTEYRCGNGRCIREAHVCDGVCDCLDECEDENSCHSFDCVKEEKYLCRPTPFSEARCILREYVCDTDNDCRDSNSGMDEYYCPIQPNCSSFEQLHHEKFFMCPDPQRCIKETYKCDGFADCLNGEDEEECDKPRCKASHLQCSSGVQCYPKAGRCDLKFDCNDRSDEADCKRFTCPEHHRSCGTGQCLQEDKWCDFRRDCPDGSDERSCERIECEPGQFRCKSGQCIDHSLVCYMSKTSDGCVDMSHLFNCSHHQCKKGTFKCRDSYCIESSQVCDGILDCKYTKWDEEHCDFNCPLKEEVCICDGDSSSMNCKDLDLVTVPYINTDEHFTKLYFAKNKLNLSQETFSSKVFDKVTHLDLSNNAVKEIPGGMFSHMWRLTHLSLSYNNISFLNKESLVGLTSLRQLHLSTNRIAKLQPETFVNLTNLRTLDLSKQELTNISRNSFKGLKRVLTLDLSLNNIALLETGAFNGLEELISLNLSNNRIEELPRHIFLGLAKLEVLDLSSNKIHHIASGVFQALKSIENIRMPMNSLSKLDNDAFVSLPNLKLLVTDAYKFCCLAADSVQCLPEPNEFSSCEDLMSNYVLRISIWVLGILALVGNLVVIVWRLRDFRGGRVHSFLITNLAIGDFLMGVYLIIIATVDTKYRGHYIIHDEAWRQSDLCRFAGFISTFSSELSVLTLTTITLDRLICILFPLKRPRLGLKQAIVVMIFIWSFVFLISLLPLFDLGYFKDFYGRSGVCLALPVTPDRPSGWEYSIALFLVLNLVSFLLIAASYMWMFSVAKKTQSAVRTTENRNDTAMARRMTIIVMTDFCCWVPIIVLGFISLAGIRADNQVYAWIAVFVLPLNSATNPILYTLYTAPFLGKIRKRATRFRKSFINSMTAGSKHSYVEDRTSNSFCERKSPYRQMELLRLRSLNNSAHTFYSRDLITEA